MNRLLALQIGSTPPEPMPVSRALIAAFWTIFAMLTVWAFPSLRAEGSQLASGAHQAYLVLLVAMAWLTAAPALMLRSSLRQNEQRRRALQDPLTRLASLQLLRLDLARALARAGRTGSLVTVITLEIGGLAMASERLGASARHLLLVDISRRLKRSVRAKDTVARTADDEFAILLAASSSSDDGAWTTERALEELDAPFQVEDEEVLITASAGIGISLGADSTPELLLQTAEAALARARSSGRSRYGVLYTDMLDLAA
jgi:diguanylate cyclase (GGDEF)-like protein